MQGDFFLTTWFLEAMRWLYENIGSVFLTILISTRVLMRMVRNTNRLAYSDSSRDGAGKDSAGSPESARSKTVSPFLPSPFGHPLFVLRAAFSVFLFLEKIRPAQQAAHGALYRGELLVHNRLSSNED